MDHTRRTMDDTQWTGRKAPQESGDGQIPVNLSRISGLRKAIQDIPPDLKLSGTPGKSLLDVSDPLLTYIWAVLRNEFPLCPEASPGEWDDLLSILASHWIIPALYWHTGSLPPECRPPEPITDRIRKAFLMGCVQCLHMERQLGEIYEAFQAKGVPMLVLRGPGLGWSVYPDPAMRPGCDLDLLVLPEQVVRARGILEGLDYRCLGKRFESGKDFYREEGFVHQRNPRDNLPVDLHWGYWELHPFFESRLDLGIKDLFHRAWKVESSALAFDTLHPVDALIHGVIHLAMIHKGDMRLIWIYDTALLARRIEIPDDWEALQERSVFWRARLALEHALKMAEVWFGLQLPDGFNDFSKWPRATDEESMIWSHVMRHHWATFLFKRSLSSPSGLLKLLRSLFRLLFPNPDMVRFCYPVSHNWFLPLSYFRRWQRWFRDLILNRIWSVKQQD